MIKSLDVFGAKIPVKKEDLSEVPVYGYFRSDTMEITIDKKLKGQTELHTLLHELVHALLHRTGVTQAISHDVNEIISENVATTMVENFEIRPKRKSNSNRKRR